MNELDLLKRNAGISEDSQMIQVRVINSGFGSDRGMMDAQIISQELDHRMMPFSKLELKMLIWVTLLLRISVTVDGLWIWTKCKIFIYYKEQISHLMLK